MGSSIVYWAAEAAKVRPGGKSLGLGHLATLEWKGHRGMHWHQFDFKISAELRRATTPPTHVFIQLGSNDLVSTKNLDLIHSIEGSIYRLRLLLPDVTIIWSDILQRCFWYGARNQKKINQTRRRVNTAAHRIIRPEGGKMLRHPTIVAKESSLFRPDGTHLSASGNDIYLNDIQGGLEIFLTTNVDTFPPVN